MPANNAASEDSVPSDLYTGNSFIRPKPPISSTTTTTGRQSTAVSAASAIHSRNSLETSSKSLVRSSFAGHDNTDVDQDRKLDEGGGGGDDDEDEDEVQHRGTKYEKPSGNTDPASQKKSVTGGLSKLKKEEEEEGKDSETLF